MPNSILNQENADDAELVILEQKLGYKFKNIHHLRVATTHSSFCNLENYERYEFLGDSIVNFVIGKYLFNTIKDVDEGALTKMRSALICGSSLCSIARRLNLGYYIRLAKGEIQNNGRTRDSILEDAVEAICAAIYLDSSSFATTEQAVLNIFKDQLKQKDSFKTGYRDPKTLLQEIVQELFKNKPTYVLVRTEGKSHNQTFYAECIINELDFRTPGVGKNKRKAEQEAASLMIRKLRETNTLSQEQLDKVQHL
ncbi:ribonuclease III [Psittacicella gerlachiana]|uniref:Ribonuclease 3 n=1 Tax=Psittacicella gerlachiana TaxID=2028574 RepID=A0A3A1YCB8_9GAMM|nr:ribonuclease III [Psittacicella gerlachiana]RIY34828.1 ribonuclease III [Psittacicella gerlachiana]